MDRCTYFRCKATKTFDEHVEALIEHAADYRRCDIAAGLVTERGLRGIAFHKVSRPPEPEWLTLVSELTGENLRLGFSSIYHSAILLVEVGGVTYALTFGTGHTIAKRLAVEQKFGKVVVSNGKIADEVRGIKANVTGHYGKTRIERRGRGGPTRVLEVPRSSLALSSVAAKLSLVEDHIAEGGIGIRTIGPTDEQNLLEIIDQLEIWYDGGSQADALLASYDRIVEVKDKELIESLNELLIAEIDVVNSPYFSLSVDADELWEATEHAYSFPRGRPRQLGLSVTEFVAALRVAKQAGHAPHKVKLVSRVGGHDRDSLLVHNLSFELPPPQNGTTYLWESGVWFEAAASWTATIANGMQIMAGTQQAARAILGLPRFSKLAHRDEDGYLRAVCADLGPRAEACHVHLPPPEHPRLEVCDVLIDGRYLIFAKQGSAFAACSSAASQAIQAATGLSDDPSFAQWARTTFFEPHEWTLDLLAGRHNLTLVILLLTTRPADVPLELTVRAQDALLQFHREVTRLGFEATVIGV